jgi:broad specificity phosphatase PhoE
MACAARSLPDQGIDRVIASPLSRAWAGARIVVPRGPILLEPDFREIHFGDWEGLTAEEIERLDAEGFRRWREGPRDFGFPGGEERGAFRARVSRGLARLLRSPVRSPLVVAHHGVIRAMVEELCAEPAPEGAPALGGLLQVRRDPRAGWRLRVLSTPETP